MPVVRIYDNGAGFAVTLNGIIIDVFSSLGNAWRHIAWMHRVASQKFLVGDSKLPVEEWIEAGIRNGFFDKDIGFSKPRG